LAALRGAANISLLVVLPQGDEMMMNAIVSRQPAPAENATRRLVLRMNGTLFHCLGMALLLETHAVARARSTGRDDLGVREREEHVRWLQCSVAQLWPEFGWNAATNEFDHGEAAVEPPETVARCAALICSAVSRWADDPLLRVSLHAMVEAGHRTLSSSQPRMQARKRLWSDYAFLSRRGASALRKPIAARAFRTLQIHWTDAPPFDVQTFPDFLQRFAALAAPHARLDWRQRLLLWLPTGARAAARSHARPILPAYVGSCADDDAPTARRLPHAPAVR
jgi:hypothetical protein